MKCNIGSWPPLLGQCVGRPRFHWGVNGQEYQSCEHGTQMILASTGNKAGRPVIVQKRRRAASSAQPGATSSKIPWPAASPDVNILDWSVWDQIRRHFVRTESSAHLRTQSAAWGSQTWKAQRQTCPREHASPLLEEVGSVRRAIRLAM